MNRSWVGFVILMAGLTCGCNPPGSLGLPPGRYEGSLIRRVSGELTEVAVEAQIAEAPVGTWMIDLKDLNGKAIEKDALSARLGHVSVSVPSLKLNQLSLTSQRDCYLGAVQKTDVRVCETGTALLIEVRDAKGTRYSLSLQQFSGTDPLKAETPRVYTLDRAMNRAFTTSFQTRAQFERAMQAAHVATNTWWNLLPRLNMNSGTSVAKSISGGFLEILGSVGDLAPFLLPNRWIQAENASTQSDAEKIALQIMRGDTGAQVESMIYTWKKDADVLKQFDSVISDSEKLVKTIRDLEGFGNYPRGTADSIQSTVEAMRADQQTIAAGWDDEKAALAQAMGFTNPEAVENITIGDLPSQPDIDQLTEETFEREALNRSLELLQMHQLIQIAKRSKKGAWFEWLDPSGDPSVSMGAAFPSSLEIAQDQINALETQRDTLEASVLQNARSALDDYHVAEDQEKLASEDLALQQKREQRVLDLVKYGRDTNLVELIGVYQDLLRAMTDERTAQAAIQVARVKIERLLLEGYYSKLSFAGPNP